MISLRGDRSGNSQKVPHNAGGARCPSWALSSHWRAIGLEETSPCGVLPAWGGVICTCFFDPSVYVTVLIAVLQPHLHILEFFQFLGRGAKSGTASVTFLLISLQAHDNLCSHFCSLRLHYFSLPFSILCGWGFPNGSKIFSSFMSPITRFSNDGWPTHCCWKVVFSFLLGDLVPVSKCNFIKNLVHALFTLKF